MSSREKAAASGLCVAAEQSEVGGVDPIDWQTDHRWHLRVGNGEQIPNVGLVLMTVLASLKVRVSASKEAVEGIYKIEPASTPAGLTCLSDGSYTLDVGGAIKSISHQGDAFKIHKLVHDKRITLWQCSIPQLKEFMAGLKCSMGPFNKAKTKEEKIRVALQEWFQKEMPDISSPPPPPPSSMAGPKTKAQAKKKSTVEAEEQDMKAKACCPGELLKEEPEFLARIIILKQEWWNMIEDGSKTMELRKSSICCQPETFYLGVGNIILGRSV